MTSFPRLDVLPTAQRALWPELAAVSEQHFVLYGGTAIALYLGHRESIDFDFFTERQYLPEELIAKFRFLEGAEFLQMQADTLTAVTATGKYEQQVKLSFFGDLTFGRLENPRRTPDGVLQIASPQDLLAHTLKTLLQRVDTKDYIDIDALLSSGLDLAMGCAGAHALFDAFAPQECLKALTYFKDEELHSLSASLQQRLVHAVAGVKSIPNVLIKARQLAADV
jgi:SHS2 domain-containing protein